MVILCEICVVGEQAYMTMGQDRLIKHTIFNFCENTNEILNLF